MTVVAAEDDKKDDNKLLLTPILMIKITIEMTKMML